MTELECEKISFRKQGQNVQDLVVSVAWTSLALAITYKPLLYFVFRIGHLMGHNSEIFS